MEEKVFFEYEDVKITNSRFLTDSQTFAMSNVTSVKPHRKSPNRTPGVIGIMIGLSLFFAQSFIIGLIVIGLSIYFMTKQKPLYTVILKTSSGENRALSTYQKEYLNQVIDALNEAIIYRG
ncbi:DUF6232 family protein [Neptunomonas sp. XY-337]|uniref:DUF6232 family protein n=1 Tax=Neptunomonas sp. XY-337 TaxID=2561897 RepID=UPI0010AAFE6F|nr:DUF6232 family protein [Neptunomonas sp. XY-337]